MKVSELIAHLQTLPQESNILIKQRDDIDSWLVDLEPKNICVVEKEIDTHIHQHTKIGDIIIDT